MNALGLKLAAVWVGLQLIFFVGWTLREEARLGHGEGTSILVRTVPVDPRDLLRGQFIRLSYEFSDTRFQSRLANLNRGITVWVTLRQVGDFHKPVDLKLQKPSVLASDAVGLRGVTDRYGRLTFGIEQYFVPEGTETPNQRDITVRLRVADDGSARIETVYVKGVPWP